MIIDTQITARRTGSVWNVKYEELDTFDNIRSFPVGAAGAICFYNDKMVLVYAHKKDSWEMPGGGREDGESFEDCIIREIKEESNMKVLELFPLGLETYTKKETQEIRYVLRYAAKVEPYGEFIEDPAGGEITEIKLIDPKDYKKYFDWGERSDLIVQKAIEVINKKYE